MIPNNCHLPPPDKRGGGGGGGGTRCPPIRTSRKRRLRACPRHTNQQRRPSPSSLRMPTKYSDPSRSSRRSPTPSVHQSFDPKRNRIRSHLLPNRLRTTPRLRRRANRRPSFHGILPRRNSLA